jgi:predicted DNA-binding transcriptional regulator YafY
MNLSKSAFRRYKVIDGLLRNPMIRYPTKTDIIEACNDKLDYRPSRDTIQKDLENMRLPYPDGFDAPVKYCQRNKGYEYTDPNYSLSGIALNEDEIDTISDAVDLIRLIGGSRLSNQFNHAVEKLLSATIESRQSHENKRPILQTMVAPKSRGFEYFDLFYQASKERIPVSFIHFSYNKRTFKHTFLHPFLVKEFDNRWYVIGYSETHESVRTFGLDRISDPVRTKKKYLSTNRNEIDTYLNDIYGVYPIQGAKKGKIKIKVKEIATHYMQAYPLHESQQIVKDQYGMSEITFELIPSYELARYFLSLGNQIKLISPNWFIKFTEDLFL